MVRAFEYIVFRRWTGSRSSPFSSTDYSLYNPLLMNMQWTFSHPLLLIKVTRSVATSGERIWKGKTPLSSPVWGSAPCCTKNRATITLEGTVNLPILSSSCWICTGKGTQLEQQNHIGTQCKVSCKESYKVSHREGESSEWKWVSSWLIPCLGRVHSIRSVSFYDEQPLLKLTALVINVLILVCTKIDSWHYSYTIVNHWCQLVMSYIQVN